MELKRLDRDFTVCKLTAVDDVDFTREFVFLSKTDEEISLVCETAYMPAGAITAEPGWRAAKIAGELDFNMTGVISRLSTLLADAGISVFVVSTYNTDYLLLKASVFENGMMLLGNNGYTIT